MSGEQQAPMMPPSLGCWVSNILRCQEADARLYSNNLELIVKEITSLCKLIVWPLH